MYRQWESALNFDHLKCLNNAELLNLLEDDETIRDITRVNSQLRALQRSKVIMMASNCWLAEQNLAYQPYLTKTKLHLAEKHQDLGQLISSIRRKQRKIETLRQRFNFQGIHRFLKEKIDHSRRESKNIWQTFTEGKMLPTDFVELLQNSQKSYNKRLVQAEKIQAVIMQTQICEREDKRCPYVGHYPNLLLTPTTVNVFGGVSPVILLPGLQYSHLRTSYLPPLKHHVCVDSCFISDESGNKHDQCKCPESHRWPQRHFPLQPLQKIHQPKIPK